MAGESEQTMAGERAKPGTVARERGGLNGLKYTKLFWHSAMPKKFGL